MKNNITVPLLDLKAQYDTIRTEIEPVIKEVVESQYFILGPKVKELEEKVAAYSDAKFGIGVSSGTDALLIALMALDMVEGDEVITTPYSFFATAGVIARLGAKPVFVDIEPDYFNIDPAKIENAITNKTKAIIPVHLYGQMADMNPIMDIAKKHNLFVIEDAAQAIGSKYHDGRKAGSIGDMGCFSFFPSKNLGGFGDAGMVVTNNTKLAEKLIHLRVHGSAPKYYHKIIGGNFRIDALQAAVLNVKLDFLDQWTNKRKQNAENYNNLLGQSNLEDTFKLPNINKNYHHIFNQYILRVAKRDDLLKFLQSNNIGCEIYYPLPLSGQECFAYLGHKEGDFPESEKASNETIAIPIYPELTLEQQQHVVNKIIEFFS
jgi:dTDP-4-amino-4,6-dideoxygalactose transaminase